jgi:hypothetical protein
MRGYLLAAAALLCAWLSLPPAAQAGERGAALLDVPSTVTAGRTVVIRWPALPAEAEEVELVLSLDGGRTFPVRVSPELEPRDLQFTWRVPELPSETAVLVLRVGGRERGEQVGARSAVFRILHADGVAPPELTFHEGDLWTAPGPLEGPAATGLAAPGPHFDSGVDAAPASATPSDGFEPPAPAAERAVAPRPLPRPSLGAPRLVFARCEVPLRI